MTNTSEAAETPCRVCTIRDTALEGSIIYRDDNWTATTAMDVPGWVVLLANRHSTDWLWGLSEREESTMGALLSRLAAAIRVAAGAERVYCIGMGENSLHLHLLLVSRYADTPAEIRGPGIVAHAKELADAEQARRVAIRIRSQYEKTLRTTGEHPSAST